MSINKNIIGKYNAILKEYLDIVSTEDKSLYEELANMAIILGYVPTRDKTKGISISFRNNKTKFTIMKFAEEGKNGYFWRFKFAACKNYSKIFDESIKKYDENLRNLYSEKYNLKNVTCMRCAKCCNEKKLFYIIKYEDGREYTVCGTVAFVQINYISKDIVEEAGNMMKIQHEKLKEGK
jgi:hypothetical protein